jgi:argonaute-like protein implicated in RNA metabolism and viral defense
LAVYVAVLRSDEHGAEAFLEPEFHEFERSTPTTALIGYRATVEDFLRRGNVDYDAAIIILLDEHANLPEAHSPYLAAKAVLLMAGIPVQEAKLSTVTREAYSAQFIYQNLAIALYAKMGGIPWTVDQGLTADDEIVVGIGTAQIGGTRFDAGVRHVGITTVFRGDGNYLLSNLSRECTFEEYPDMLRQSTMDVLREIKEKNNWRPGDTVRVVFHAFKPFRDVEVAEIVQSCTAEVGAEQRIEFAFLTVANDHSFRIIDTAQRGIEGKRGSARKGVYVPDRGLIVQLGGFTRLVTANGPTLIKRATSPLPSPLLVHLHRNSTYRDQRYLAEQVLKFTTLSWRSTLPAHEPVTILYSEMIAGLLARLKAVPNWSPSALSTTRLRHCMWFL